MTHEIWLESTATTARAILSDPRAGLTATEFYALRDQMTRCLLALRGWRPYSEPPSTDTAA